MNISKIKLPGVLIAGMAAACLLFPYQAFSGMSESEFYDQPLSAATDPVLKPVQKPVAVTPAVEEDEKEIKEIEPEAETGAGPETVHETLHGAK